MQSRMFENFFLVHIPKTGGTFIKKVLPGISSSFKPSHETFQESVEKGLVKNKIPLSVVRNPYDWLHSWYYFEHTRGKIKKRDPNILAYKDFTTFILNKGFMKFRKSETQCQYIQGIPLENVLHTESLNQELEDFLKRNNVDYDFEKEPIRVNDRKPKVVWSDEMKDIVYLHYKDDFEKLGYSK